MVKLSELDLSGSLKAIREDGGIAAHHAGLFLAHVETCQDCRAKYEAILTHYQEQQRGRRA